MRYTQLRAFHHVALQGGFSRAAAALNQTQPALSDQVRRLEQTHDVLLFRRDGRQVHLTQAGEALFLLTRQFFEVEENIADYLSQSRSRIDGTLRIVADSALHITDAVGRFRQANSAAFVTIQTANTAEVLDRLRAYDAEIGVVGNHVPAADLEGVPLGETPVMAVVARGFLPPDTAVLDFAALPRWPLIFRETGSRTRQALEAEARARNIPLRPAIQVDSREAMREMVASGAGIGFVSRAELGHDTRLIALPITGAKMQMTETLVYLSMRRDLPVIRAFLRCLSRE